MGGSSFICGIFGCTNARYVFTNKPRVITFDAEIPLGLDDNNVMRVIVAVLHHYVEPDKPSPAGDLKYMVGGKFVSITSTTPVGDGYNVDDYDLEIDATFVSFLYSIL